MLPEVEAPQTKVERVVLETVRHKISGEVTLPAEGYRTRLSDLLNRENVNFIALSRATVSVDGGKPEEHDFVAVAREAVVIAYEQPL